MTSDLHIAKPHSPFLVLFIKLSAHFTPSFSKHFLHLVSRTSISCDSLSATLPLIFSVLHLLTLVPQSSVLGIILFCIYFTSWMIISPYSVSKCHLYSDNPQIYHSNQDLSLKSRLLSTSTFLTSPLGCLNGTFRPKKSKPNSWFPHLNFSPTFPFILETETQSFSVFKLGIILGTSFSHLQHISQSCELYLQNVSHI